ncbi:MAG: hypothetical protein KatS3mg102_2497 [Planctomycetota bacterium]|nr:MAG: hypothetical protein KatS3mg102_2497 [Planctomycetota bacterium]
MAVLPLRRHAPGAHGRTHRPGGPARGRPAAELARAGGCGGARGGGGQPRWRGAPPAPQPRRLATRSIPWKRCWKRCARGEATRIRGLYDWERFFAEQDERRAAAAGEPAAGPRTPAGPAELEARIAAYIQRLLERVRPTLAQTRHRVTDVKLDRSSARLRVEIRRRDTAELVQSYDFSLAHTPNGWRIVHIAP